MIRRAQAPSCSSTAGFTLLEALLSAVILGMMSAVISALFMAGIQTIEADLETVPFDSALRSRMEFLVSLNFDQLTSGSEVVAVNGVNYTLSWTVTPLDMDGDALPDPTASGVVLTLNGRSLSTLIVDNEGEIGRI